MKGNNISMYVVRIFCENEILGGGFFLDNQYVITCSHITDQIKSDNRSNKINIKPLWPNLSLNNKKSITATLEISLSDDRYNKISERDIAILKIDEKLEIVKPISLISSNELAGHNFCSLGFPKGYIENGVNTEGKISYKFADDRICIINHKDETVTLQKGFSGCPVWDESIKGIVGIIAQTEENKNFGTFISTKILKESLKKDWPKINDYIYEYNPNKPCVVSFFDEIYGISVPQDNINNLFSNIKTISEKRIDLLKSGAITEDELKKLNCLCKHVIEKWRGFRETYNIKNYKYIFNFPSYDDFHSINIELIAYKLLPRLFQAQWVNENKNILYDKNNISFSFLLLASIWLHDIGMITNLADDRPTRPDRDIENEYLDILNKHHERSIDYIYNNQRIFDLTDNEAWYLADISRLHVHKDYSELHFQNRDRKNKNSRDYINIPLITSYLRLADALQIPRKTKDVKSYMALGLDDSFAKFQWLKSQIAADIDIDSDAFKVTINLKVPEKIYNYIYIDKTPNYEKEKLQNSVDNLIQSIENEVQNEIDCVKDIIIDGRINFYLNAECAPEKCRVGKCSERDFRELLNDIELFGPRMSPNASAVIGVVLKQIEAILSGNDPKTNLENLINYNNTVLQRIKNKRPCHVFLHNVANFLADSLPNLRENPEADVISKHELIRTRIAYWNDKIEFIKKTLPDVAYGILSDKHSSLLLYGYSSSIINCLEAAISKNPEMKNIKIYVCEAATKKELRYNNRLVYSDGLRYINELKKLKIHELYYITDVCPAHLFSKGKITKVLFGANGIEPNGNIHHTLGHLAIAEMAHKHDIWVFVIADSLKIGVVDKSKLGKLRGNEWLTTDIDKETILKSDGATKVINYNPRGDVVSAELISAIILENGIIEPKDVYKYVDKGP